MDLLIFKSKSVRSILSFMGETWEGDDGGGGMLWDYLRLYLYFLQLKLLVESYKHER